MLEDKVAMIYGAGPIGTAVARAFAGAGARVHLGGRTQSTLDAVAGDLRSGGADVQTHVVDALDPVTASSGRLGKALVQFNPITQGRRVYFELTPGGAGPIDLRCFLRSGAERLTETWSFRWKHD
jgi:glucan biosynthesis protein